MQLGRILRYPNLYFLSMVRFLVTCLKASKKAPGLGLYQGHEVIGLDKSFSCSVVERFLYRPILLAEVLILVLDLHPSKDLISPFWMLKRPLQEAFYWETYPGNDVMIYYYEGLVYGK